MFEKERIAVEIGEKNIKILVGTKEKVEHYGIISSPDGSVEEDKLVNIEAIANAINSFILDKKIKTKKLSFVIESRDVVTRNMETPIMDEEGIQKSVEWEISQYLPSAKENYYMDFEIIEKIVDKNKKIYKVMIAAVPREKIDRYVELSKQLNLQLTSIDISSNCIARVFKEVYNKDHDKESTGIIDIGNSSSSIIILDKGKLFIERAVPFGMVSLYKIITENELKCFDLMNIEEENESHKRIQTLMGNVLSSFERIIQFYASGKTQKKLNQIYIIGEGALLKGIDEYIKNYFGSETNIIEEPSRIFIKTKISTELDFRLNVKALGVLLRKE